MLQGHGCYLCPSNKFGQVHSDCNNGYCEACPEGKYQKQYGQANCKLSPPTPAPSPFPTQAPTPVTAHPTHAPTPSPTSSPILGTRHPTAAPTTTAAPTAAPTACPSTSPTPAATAPLFCQPGKFKYLSPVMQTFGCYFCPPGKYGKRQQLHDSPKCFDCLAGKFQAGYGKRKCMIPELCPPGTFSEITSTHATCPMCPKSKFRIGLSKSEQCISCPAGKFQEESGQSYCFQKAASETDGACPVNMFRVDSKCRVCPMGKFGKSTVKFRGGLAVGATSLCTRCPTGRYQDIEGLLSCLACPPGKHQLLKGSSFCFANILLDFPAHAGL